MNKIVKISVCKRCKQARARSGQRACSYPRIDVENRSESGTVSVSGAEGSVVYYALNDGPFKKYRNPFALPKGGKVSAYAEVEGKMKSNRVIGFFEPNKAGWTAKTD